MPWIDLNHGHTVPVPFSLSFIYSLKSELDTFTHNALHTCRFGAAERRKSSHRAATG